MGSTMRELGGYEFRIKDENVPKFDEMRRTNQRLIKFLEIAEDVFEISAKKWVKKRYASGPADTTADGSDYFVKVGLLKDGV